MGIRDRVELRPAGITYVTLGGLREDMLEVAGAVDGILSGSGEMSDEAFRASTLSRIDSMKCEMEELVDGMNFLWDILSSNGLTPPRTQGSEDEE